DAPGGGGKIPLLPQYVLGRAGTNIILRNYKYDIFTYPDVEEEPANHHPPVEKPFLRKRRNGNGKHEPERETVEVEA
ncbi:MAG: hypothetical protein HYZ33_00440, partial [Ignavibacteriales bacterium]|nr:hypothetical protein [Ignavibacteriales bacterium]